MQNLQKLGWFLFIASFLPWLAILFIVPFLPLSIAEKTQIDVVLAVLAEVCFWLSVVILGKEVVTKYRSYLNPRYLWNKIRKFNRRSTGIDAHLVRSEECESAFGENSHSSQTWFVVRNASPHLEKTRIPDYEPR